MIIGICGKKQVGKDSMAGFIKKQLPELKIQQISFAKPLKDFVHEVLNIPKKNLYGSDADKNYPLCTWGEIFHGPALKAYEKQDRTLLSAREILQVVGTDIMRKGHMDYANNKLAQEIRVFLARRFGAGTEPFLDLWIDLAIQDIEEMKARGELDVAVISDVRFHNELRQLKAAGAVMIRLYRDTGCEDSIPHPSEMEMDEMSDNDFDVVVYEEHNETLKQLENVTTRLLMSNGLLEDGGIAV